MGKTHKQEIVKENSEIQTKGRHQEPSLGLSGNKKKTGQELYGGMPGTRFLEKEYKHIMRIVRGIEKFKQFSTKNTAT